MFFYSFEFLFLFLPITLGLFFLTEIKFGRRPAIIFLVMSSLVFYGVWNPAYLALLSLSILFNYYLGHYLQKHASRLLMWLGVAANLCVLGYYKYANFFLDTIDALAGTSWQIEQIILPLAISFYTFQQIAWLVDSYSKRVDTKTEGFWHYALFVSFFPQLIAGPIVHHTEMMPQFAKDSTFRPRWDSLAIGLTIFIIGLTKKVVIADELAAIATPVFTEAETGTVALTSAWMAAFCYTFQVYFDFSGYSDMAIGLARMFNIRLPMNFRSPFKATSIIDLWAGWHITMTRFFQTYVYMPLSIMFFRIETKWFKKGSLSIYVSTFITFLAIGFWHGANWTYLIFGFMHGCFVLINHMWRNMQKNYNFSALPKFIGCGLTFFVFMLSCVIYRAENLDIAGVMYQAMFQPDIIANEVYQLEKLILVALIAIAAFTMPNTQQIMQRYRPVINTSLLKRLSRHSIFYRMIWRPTALWGAIILALYIMCLNTLMDAGRVQEFIYFQF